MAKSKLSGAEVSNEKTVDDVASSVSNAGQEKKGFSSLIEDKKRKELLESIEPKSSDLEELDLSSLNPAELSKKLEELQAPGVNVLRGWDAKNKIALLNKKEFIERRKKIMEGLE